MYLWQAQRFSGQTIHRRLCGICGKMTACRNGRQYALALLGLENASPSENSG